MITLTDTARTRIEEFVRQADDDCIGVRVLAAKVGRHTFRYQLQLTREQDLIEGDTRLEQDGFDLVVDPQTAELMEGSTIDYITVSTGEGFEIHNPAADPGWEDPLYKKVQEVIDTKVLPVVGAHGGWVELDRIEGDTAYVSLGGGCQGCASAGFTLSAGIEQAICQEVDEIEHVVDVTDHGAGQQPFYRE
ncbi:MAG TPA: iron-sulfur cluster assembly accessory protein [Methylomirabilota bacterium]|nr:iron-sulfur cluster assembly accessory protein [Methylomirabilota bacterium]